MKLTDSKLVEKDGVSRIVETPTGDIAAMEIENLNRELHAYISELGFEFPNGYSIERSVVMSVPVFYESWRCGDYEID